MKVTKIAERLFVFIKFIFGCIVFGIFSVFPLENKVVFSNFSGKCYGDNPRYISETLHILYPQISIVWLKHKGYDFETPEYVKQIKWPSVRMIKELCTARVWVDSHTKPIYIKKRKGQYFIETWHGGLGIKKIEDDVIGKQSFSYIVNFLHNTKMVDVFLSNSTWISNIYRETFHYKGKIIECGYPKNDIFFQNNVGVIAKVKKNLGLTSEKIVLYAPTFRNQSTIDWFDIDFIKLHECLEAQFNCKYIILIKLHPLMMKQSKKMFTQIQFLNFVKDVTMYPDMQELLLASDLFITDYSSCIFDFALMRKPAFLYASDYEEYQKEQGTYFDIRRDLPFSFAETTDMLIENIYDFSNEEYQSKLEKYFMNEKIGLKDVGTASNFVAELIKNKMKIG